MMVVIMIMMVVVVVVEIHVMVDDRVAGYDIEVGGVQGSSYAGRGRPPLTISARHPNFFFLVPFLPKTLTIRHESTIISLKNVK